AAGGQAERLPVHPLVELGLPAVEVHLHLLALLAHFGYLSPVPPESLHAEGVDLEVLPHHRPVQAGRSSRLRLDLERVVPRRLLDVVEQQPVLPPFTEARPHELGRRDAAPFRPVQPPRERRHREARRRLGLLQGRPGIIPP
ncbi:unnamed protein product, partial [Ectocarpus fasciculatus]